MRLRALVVSAVCLVVAGCAEQEPLDPVFPTPTPTSTPTLLPTAQPPVYPTATPVAPVAYESTRVRWGGNLWYLHGANLPWFNWGCDFGCGATGGASSKEVREGVSKVVRDAKGGGLNVIRWWMFPGDPNQFVLSATGEPIGLKPTVYVDIDAAIKLAQDQNVYLVFVLFSAPSHIPTAWMADPSARTLLASVVGGLAARYGKSNRVLAWEVFNEPEWDIWSKKSSQFDVVDTVTAITTQIHQQSSALVTVGSATIEGLGMWSDAGLDFYSPHWYDPMGPSACALCTDYEGLRAKYGVDKPVVVGEFFAGSTVDSARRYTEFYAKGFAGAWAWSLLPDKTEDRLSIDLAASGALPASNRDVGPK